jgi:DNA-binding NtrC family response regulator
MSVLQDKKILVINDDLGFRESICMLLNESGAIAIPVTDGFGAIQFLKTDSFDLIITCSSIQGMTSIDLYREMMAKDIITPILIMLSFSNGDAHAVLTNIEDRDIILKPFKAVGIKRLIERVLEDSITWGKAHQKYSSSDSKVIYKVRAEI